MDSLWSMSKYVWAVCDGSGPVPVRGLITFGMNGWLAYDAGAYYPDLESAVVSLGFLVEDLRGHVVARSGDVRTVLASDPVLERMQDEGWIVIVECDPLSEAPSILIGRGAAT
jgi:hypothetical protein